MKSSVTQPPAHNGNRRTFFKSVLATAALVPFQSKAATLASNARYRQRPLLGPGKRVAFASGSVADPVARQTAALSFRQKAANFQASKSVPVAVNNGDEDLVPRYAGSFCKTLDLDGSCLPNPSDYQALVKACSSGAPSDFSVILRGSGKKLANPLAGYSYLLEGADPSCLYLPPAPGFSSAGMAADLVELYWKAICRDVAFSDYPTSPLVRQACDELSSLSGYAGPSSNETGLVTPGSINRGLTSGDLVGPFLSQFLLKPIPVGSALVEQKYRTGLPGQDYMTAYSEWVTVQQGSPIYRTELFDDTFRYIRNGRDLAQYFHYDFPYQAFLYAAQILFDQRPETILNLNLDQVSPTSPYKKNLNQGSFVTWGLPHVQSLIGRVTTASLHACWFQKWAIHRRIRPEMMAGRVHSMKTGADNYPIHPELLNAKALDVVFQANGTYLLPQAYVEGCPNHPSYPCGHTAIAGACATILKAFFDENFLIAGAVTPSADGLSLIPFDDGGTALTLGNELNKLAANVAAGRDFAGVHYRSDCYQGNLLGEQVAIAILQDEVNSFAENFSGFQFTAMDGTKISIKPTK